MGYMASGIELEARRRATEGIGPRQQGRCQQWVRQCVQAMAGDAYDSYWRGSALLTAQAFAAHPPPGCTVIPTSKVSRTRLGDILYCTEGHGGYGHVGIRVVGNRVAENSVVHSGPHGGIGFRALKDFDFDLIVRLT